MEIDRKATCLICLEKLEDDYTIVLHECEHRMCRDCFDLFLHKLNTDKCPACTQHIVEYSELGGKKYKLGHLV